MVIKMLVGLFITTMIALVGCSYGNINERRDEGIDNIISIRLAG